tara:strand:+ start:532 stop:657 length:126 start_codon:yes stop_codon:yes gene_type:complete
MWIVRALKPFDAIIRARIDRKAISKGINNCLEDDNINLVIK